MDAFASGCEWLEADGLGGYASGTPQQIRTRRYHALLLVASKPPTGRVVLVAGFDGVLESGGERFGFTTQAYAGGVFAPTSSLELVGFDSDPWPHWTWRLPCGERLEQEIFAVHGAPRVVVAWRLVDASGSPLSARIVVRPFLAARDHHALQRAEPEAEVLLAPPVERDGGLVFASPGGRPAVRMRGLTRYVHDPHWYRRFHLAEEARRGFDSEEDLASPGELVFELVDGEAGWIVEATSGAATATSVSAAAAAARTALGPASAPSALDLDFDCLRQRERQRRASFATALDRAADAYLVRRGEGHTIVAGYPWFTDWGRDTFIALRGLCLARGELALARKILIEWSGAISEGMLPNRFADDGESIEYNTADASLWFVVCVEALLQAYAGRGRIRGRSRDRGREIDRALGFDDRLEPEHERRLAQAVDAILSAHARGTRHGIRLEPDGLLAAGLPGLNLTWMDARIGHHVVTPRIGKPVEIQALWWNALRCGARFDGRWAKVAERTRASFGSRFWNAAQGTLHDVVDVDHVAGRIDPRMRPNQLFAIGGLPLALLEGERARSVVAECEKRLWTPAGLRSLAPEDPEYVSHYRGGPVERDQAYHQGTVWPWLVGAFVEAWLRVYGASPARRAEARRRFVEPLRERARVAGLGHLFEIADAEPPHSPQGCPFQAWSVAELIRLEREVLTDPEPALPAVLPASSDVAPRGEREDSSPSAPR